MLTARFTTAVSQLALAVLLLAAICANADCAGSTLGSAATLVNSPNSSVYFYTGLPVFVNWSYTSDTDTTTFPSTSVVIYYKFADTSVTTWVKWLTVGAKDTSVSAVMTNAVARSYNIRVVPDDIDPTGLTGTIPSCYSTSFPRMGVNSFRLLTTRDLSVSSSDSFAPNSDSSGGIASMLTPAVLSMAVSVAVTAAAASAMLFGIADALL
ncbi:hypothetical protein HK105_205277 [Polyrhizophydium stewartii]|uniref:Uncharacterized protein n=1 Tax=Polyrhizophydium stewartii TaxID=2732419 RepID=A0ABR4N6S1_9FUNG